MAPILFGKNNNYGTIIIIIRIRILFGTIMAPRKRWIEDVKGDIRNKSLRR